MNSHKRSNTHFIILPPKSKKLTLSKSKLFQKNRVEEIKLPSIKKSKKMVIDFRKSKIKNQDSSASEFSPKDISTTACSNFERRASSVTRSSNMSRNGRNRYHFNQTEINTLANMYSKMKTKLDEKVSRVKNFQVVGLQSRLRLKAPKPFSKPAEGEFKMLSFKRIDDR